MSATTSKSASSKQEALDVLSALKRYEKTVGLAYDELPPSLCDGIHLQLRQWSLVVTDNSLNAVASATHRRVTESLAYKSDYEGALSLEEELEKASEANVKGMSKKKNRLEMTLAAAMGQGGPSAEEQNQQEEDVKNKNSVAKKLLWDSQMSKYGLLSLDISGSEHVTDRGIKALADVCSSLKVLSIEGCYQVTDVGLRALAMSCTMLRELNLSGCMGIAGPGFAVVGQCCRGLTALRLSGCRQIPTWVLLNVFEGCRLLEDLDLSHCTKLGDHEVKSMSEKCGVLRVLNLHECKQVSDVGVLAISQGCLSLEELDLSRSELQFKITDVSLLALGERSAVLKKLNLNGCEMVSDAGLSWLSKGCLGLEWIDLTNCSKVTNGGMRCLGESCPDLKHCQLANLKKVTDVGLRFLAQGCPKLHNVNLSGMFLLSDGMKRDFGFEGLQAMGRAPCASSIKTLNLTGCFQVSTVALKSLSLLVNVENLCLSGCVNLTAQGMTLVAEAMTHMKSLSLAFCGDCVTDSMMTKCLKYWTKLRSVILTECEQVGPGTLKSLSTCKSLRRVDLTGCFGVDDLALLPLCEAAYWPGINALYLTGCKNVGDTGLSWIADGLKSTTDEVTLVTLALKGTHCSVSAVKAIRDRYRYSDLKVNDSFFGLWPHPRATDRMVINDYGTLFRSASKIQALARGVAGRKKAGDVKKKHDKLVFALNSQKLWRGHRARVRVGEMLSVKRLRDQAATIIQYMYKAWAARKHLRAKRRAKWLQFAGAEAGKIQKVYRGMLGRRKFSTIKKQRIFILEKQSKASIWLQKLGRRYLARCEYWRRKEKKIARDKLRWKMCWKMQCSWRQHSARGRVRRRREKLQNRAELRRDSATKIQNRYRCHRCKMSLKIRLVERSMKTVAAIGLQSLWRARVAWLEVETRRQVWFAKKESRSATKLQAAWRRKAAFIFVANLRRSNHERIVLRITKAGVIERWFRGCLAKRAAAELRKKYLAQLQRMADLENWGGTTISSAWRGKKGRDIARNRKWAKKARWKEMWSDAESRKFYYNQVSGEIRYRKPQDLLDLMRRPICSNCEFYEARMECAQCSEFFCNQCWDSVHFGGKRAKHNFRNLYDYYEKRVDYGDGEFPSKWPSEVQQDEFSGWNLRVFPARQPYKIVGEWEIYINDETEKKGGKEFFYHNRLKHLSQYDKPEELKGGAFDDDWQGLDETALVAMQRSEVVKPFPKEGELPEEVLDDWGKYWDIDSNSFYYFNTLTGESTYDRPDNFQTRNDPFGGVRMDQYQ